MFFVSVNGQFNHWDGQGFERMETPTTVHLSDVMGTGPDDVWAVGYDRTIGKSTVVNYNGDAWSLVYETGRSTEQINPALSLLGNITRVQPFPNNPSEAWF